MESPVSYHIRDLLVSEMGGFFGGSGGDIFISREPSFPSNCVTIYDTDSYYENPRFGLDDLSIQVRVRATTYQDCYERIKSIKVFLQSRSNFIVENNCYVGIWVVRGIYRLPYDDNDRALCVVNFRVMREADPVHIGNRMNITNISQEVLDILFSDDICLTVGGFTNLVNQFRMTLTNNFATISS